MFIYVYDICVFSMYFFICVCVIVYLFMNVYNSCIYNNIYDYI